MLDSLCVGASVSRPTALCWVQMPVWCLAVSYCVLLGADASDGGQLVETGPPHSGQSHSVVSDQHVAALEQRNKELEAELTDLERQNRCPLPADSCSLPLTVPLTVPTTVDCAADCADCTDCVADCADCR